MNTAIIRRLNPFGRRRARNDRGQRANRDRDQPQAVADDTPLDATGDVEEVLVDRMASDIPADLLAFLQAHVDSFAKWDVIHFFHMNPYTIDTAEKIALYIGRDTERLRPALADLAAQGVLNEQQLENMKVYSLAEDPELQDLLRRFAEKCNDRQFKVKAVYQIIKGMR